MSAAWAKAHFSAEDTLTKASRILTLAATEGAAMASEIYL